MKKNNTTTILIFSAITMIAGILLFIFFFKVIENKNEHTAVVITTLMDKMREKENAIINASKVTEVKAIEDSLDNYFVDPDKIDTFVGYLEGVGANLGSIVSVESIEIPQKTKNIIDVKVSIVGTFKEVMETITFLENIPYQINITQIYLNKDTKQIAQSDFKTVPQTRVSQTLKWQADISFNILSLK